MNDLLRPDSTRNMMRSVLTRRQRIEFSREFDRQEPVEKCEVAFFQGITACHPSVTPVTL